MSGIAGVIYPDVFHLHKFMDGMLRILTPRGQEENHDSFTSKNFRLGVSNGKVATSKNQSLIAVLHGTVYNQTELRTRLKAEGFPVEGDNPAEIVLQAYHCFGETFANELDGEFVAALYDTRKQLLFLYRDRVGIKPLFWYNDRKHFLFASQLKALLSTGIVPQTPAKDALAAYLTLGYIPQDLSAIEGVNKLLPAHYLRYSAEKGMSIHPYWSYGSFFLQEKKLEPKELLHEFDHLLTKSVKERAKPEDTGCFLSGGLGSAGTAYFLRKNRPCEEINAFTVGFQGENEVDVVAASGFAESLNLTQKIEYINPNSFLKDFIPITWNMDEPLSDPISVATWTIGKLASQNTKFVLSGMGSDELTAGHSRYSTKEMAPPLERFLENSEQWLLHYVLIPIYRIVKPEVAFKMLKHARTNIWLSDYLRLGSIFSPHEIEKACPALGGLFNNDLFLHRFHNLAGISSTVSSFMYLDFKTRLPDLYISQYDKLTSAQGVHWCSPFLAKNVIEFLATLVEPSQISEQQTAAVLKKTLESSFPIELLKRPKRTRKHFLAEWVEPTGLDKIFPLLRKGTLVESGILSERWIADHTSSLPIMEKNFSKLWALLSLEAWFQLFVNFPVGENTPPATIEELLKK